MIAATWLRIMGLALVVPSLSKLILTLDAMLGSANVFICIIIGYICMFATFGKIIFQESNIAYINIIWSMRIMFDAMMGNNPYDTEESYKYYYWIFLCLHIYISNIFLLNYLVAILSTVYEIMLDAGEFAFMQ